MCEDRYSAIRWAIATAQKGDVVVIAGKGEKDWTEVSDGEDGYIRVSLLVDRCFLLYSHVCVTLSHTHIWYSVVSVQSYAVLCSSFMVVKPNKV